MEHREGPEVDGVPRHPPVHYVAERVQIGSAVMVDDPLGVARRSRRVVECDRVPLVGGTDPLELRIPLFEERLVIRRSHERSSGPVGIHDVDHQLRPSLPQHEKRFLYDGRKLGVGQEGPRFAVLQHESDGLGVESDVQCVQNRTRHRDPEMAFDHRRHVGEHDGDGISSSYPPTGKSRGESAGACERLAPREIRRAVNRRRALGVHARGSREEIDRGERLVVGGALLQSFAVAAGIAHFTPPVFSSCARRGEASGSGTPRGCCWR